MTQPPRPRLIRTPDDAEQAAAEWLRSVGYRDVRAALGAGADGGVDLRGTGIIGQVKATVSPAGRPVVQQTYGIAAAEGCQAAVFSLGGFTAQAVEWADTVGIMLFAFDLQGEPSPSNAAAAAIVTSDTSAEPREPDFPAALSEVVALTGQIIEAGRSVLAEARDGHAADADVAELMPDSIRTVDELANALEWRSPESLFNSQDHIDALDAAIGRTGVEDLELAAAARHFATLIEEFAAECKRLGLLDKSAPQPLQDMAQPFIDIVKGIGPEIHTLLPESGPSRSEQPLDHLLAKRRQLQVDVGRAASRATELFERYPDRTIGDMNERAGVPEALNAYNEVGDELWRLVVALDASGVEFQLDEPTAAEVGFCAPSLATESGHDMDRGFFTDHSLVGRDMNILTRHTIGGFPPDEISLRSD